MSAELKVIYGGAGDETQVIEVATSQLTEHSKQTEYSPQMSKKKWREFLASIAKDGILQPIVVTKGFRVIDGKHRLKAARELGIENVRVMVEDISEDDIPTYITETKLKRDDLKNGQKAAIVIRLFYEEERRKAKENFGKRTDLLPDLEKGAPKHAHVELAKKAGIGKSSMAYLLAVYKNRPDLFELVFDGNYSINKAYTQMKKDEEPDLPEEQQEFPISDEQNLVEQLKQREEELPQLDESQPGHSTYNRFIHMRKKALDLNTEVLTESECTEEVPEEVKESVKYQLTSLARSITLYLGLNSDNEAESETYGLIYELITKLEEDK